MPKIRDPKPKANIFEVTTIHTQRGTRITQVPVKDSPPSPSPSRSISPSKKRLWSPGVVQNDDYETSLADQLPKRSRSTGKVCMNVNVIWIYNQTCSNRLRTSSLKSIWLEGTASSLNYSDMNHCHRGLLAHIVNNPLAHIAARIALVPTCGVVTVVFWLTNTFHSIVFRCGMDNSLSGQTFWRSNSP